MNFSNGSDHTNLYVFGGSFSIKIIKTLDRSKTVAGLDITGFFKDLQYRLERRQFSLAVSVREIAKFDYAAFRGRSATATSWVLTYFSA